MPSSSFYNQANPEPDELLTAQGVLDQATEVLAQAEAIADRYLEYEPLLADRTYYVSPSGSNSNDGLSVATPWATLEYAIDYIYQNINPAGFTVTIQLADGTYLITATIALNSKLNGTLKLRGNPASPPNVTIQKDAGIGYPAAIRLRYGAFLEISGVAFTGNGTAIEAAYGGTCWVDNILFSTTGPGVLLWDGTFIQNGPITFYGTMGRGFDFSRGFFEFWDVINVTGCTFSNCFLTMQEGSVGYLNVSWTGSFTGKRHDLSGNSVLQTYGASEATYIPGSIAGTTTTGAQWL